MHIQKYFRPLVYISLCLAGLLPMVAGAEAIKEDNRHVRTWNEFANNVYKLHQQQISKKATDKKTIIGGYSHLPKFYKEETYYDKKTGKLLGRLQWERENPDTLHTIEVYVHDDQGRVLRDYSAAYLPYYHNAPSQTLISLHKYNEGLHAFRTFDASGDRILERCQGSYANKPVDFLLDEDDLYNAMSGGSNDMETAEYKKCFADLQQKAGVYLVPQ